MPNILQMTGYLALEISRISDIWIVLISGIQPDIKNGRISSPTLLIKSSFKWLEDSDKEDLEKETLEEQYKIVKKETNTSTVCQFGKTLSHIHSIPVDKPYEKTMSSIVLYTAFYEYKNVQS